MNLHIYKSFRIKTLRSRMLTTAWIVRFIVFLPISPHWKVSQLFFYVKDKHSITEMETWQNRRNRRREKKGHLETCEGCMANGITCPAKYECASSTNTAPTNSSNREVVKLCTAQSWYYISNGMEVNVLENCFDQYGRIQFGCDSTNVRLTLMNFNQWNVNSTNDSIPKLFKQFACSGAMESFHFFILS